MNTLVPHFDWQVLRFIRRAKRPKVEGWKLRLKPGRLTKDGEFLTQLRKAGLIEAAGDCGPPPKSEKGNYTDAVWDFAPFHLYYRLTPLGTYAAEHGEYDAPITTIGGQ